MFRTKKNRREKVYNPEAEFMKYNFIAVIGHNLESSQVSVYNVYITNQLQTTFARGGGDEPNHMTSRKPGPL
jgi:hypothetical protein